MLNPVLGQSALELLWRRLRMITIKKFAKSGSKLLMFIFLEADRD
jgi:hypothetical protein